MLTLEEIKKKVEELCQLQILYFKHLTGTPEEKNIVEALAGVFLAGLSEGIKLAQKVYSAEEGGENENT